MIYELYKRTIGSSFVAKLILVYTVVIVVSLLLVSSLALSDILSEFESNEIKEQERILGEMNYFIEERYSDINDTMLQLYRIEVNENSIQDILGEPYELARSSNEYYQIKSILNNMCLSQSIIDLIILDISDVPRFYASSNIGRSIALEYDFSNNEFLQRVKEDNSSINVFGDAEVPKYILYPEEKVISFAGVIYNQENLLNPNPVGTYIMNIKVKEITARFKEFVGEKNSQLMILGGEGKVIYDSNEKLLGEVYPLFDEIEGDNKHQMLNDSHSLINVSDIGIGDLKIVMETPKEEVFGRLDEIRKKVSFQVLLAVVVAIILSAVISSGFSMRIKEIAKKMKKIENGDFSAKIVTKSHDEIGMLANMFNEMSKELKGYIERVYIADIKTKNAEISALQSRINPHFMCNMIEIMRMQLLKKGEKEHAEMIAIMGNLFRWNVNGEGIIVRLEDEIDYTKMYLDFEVFRYGDKLNIDIDIDSRIIGMGVPKLILQPIIENAVYHGLHNKEGVGDLRIKGILQEHSIKISIYDNGSGMNEDLKSELIESLDNSEKDFRNSKESDEYHIGLKNVHQRLKLIFGEAYGLVIDSKKDQWTEVSLIMPALPKKEMENYVQTTFS